MIAIGIGILLLLALIALGLPLAFAFGAGAILMGSLLALGHGFFSLSMYRILTSFAIMAAPFFIFAGNLMTAGGLSDRLIGVADALVGRVKGGLGHVCVLACMFFGAISGSSIAAVAAISSIMMPRMVEKGYPKPYVTALISSSGILGQLIPPSIPVIIYGMISGVSIAAVFLATVIPGIIMGGGYMTINYFMMRKVPITSEAIVGVGMLGFAKELGKRSGRAFFALLAPFVILGGIYGGIFTPTEAGCVAVVYGLLVGFLIYRGLNLRTFLRSTLESVNMSGAILILVGLAVVLVSILTLEEVPTHLVNAMTSLTTNPYILLLFVNAFLLVQGMFMGDAAGTILATPLLLPLVTSLGMHPVHFGAMLMVNLGVGLTTPPVAPCLFVGARVANLPLSAFVKHVLVFILFAGLPTILLTTYIPELSMWLPHLIMGPKI